MKFILALVALAVCAQASVIVPSPYAYAAYSAPLIARPIDGTYTERQFAPRLAYAASPLAYAAHYPTAYAAPFAAPYAAPFAGHYAYAAPAAVVATPLEPTYTAATRGAVHVAPLPGHSESTSAVNLEAAPGTL